ncbi:hypothetical protein [Halopenitus malekzadehii]|uniref:hypothetical protein n=1 Tax=Halopenitus malekzadehii TaxID=1267564 RepID=UPI000B87BFBA|nr:hypothetical protein [Halopenitus malekzadehii]
MARVLTAHLADHAGYANATLETDVTDRAEAIDGTTDDDGWSVDVEDGRSRRIVATRRNE